MAAKQKVLDFSGVKDGGGGTFRPRRRPEGDYYAVIDAVADHTSQEGNEGWAFTIKVNGDVRATYPYYVNFDTKQLWKSRGLCIAAGIKVPSGKVKLDPNKLVGRVIGIALVDDEYEGRVKSTIDAVFPVDDINDPMNDAKAKVKARATAVADDDDEDEEDDEPTPRKSSKKATKTRRPVDDEDEEDDDVDTDDDEDDEPPAKKKAPTKSKARKKVEDDDEDEDDDEPPARKSKKAPATKKSKRKPVEDDDDDEDELDLDEL